MKQNKHGVHIELAGKSSDEIVAILRKVQLDGKPILAPSKQYGVDMEALANLDLKLFVLEDE